MTTLRPPDSKAFGFRFVSAISIGALLNPVNSSIIAIALVAIGRTFSAGSDRTTWLVSALYLATAIGQPTMGRLADRIGPRRVYLAGAGLVMAGGVLGSVAPTLGVLVVARVVIGLGTSAAYPAAMAVIRRQSTRLNQPAPSGVLSSLAVAGQVTMAIGPTLGGLLILVGGWRFTFLVNVPLGLLSAVLAVLWLPADEPVQHREPLWRAIDPPGVVLFAAALTTLLVFLMNLADPSWWLLGLAVALFAGLTAWELRAEAPFVDVRMLARNRGLTTTYVRYGFTMLLTYCFIYSWAIWLQQDAGRSASAAGLLMTPSFAVATAVSLFAARPKQVQGLLVGAAVASIVGGASLIAVTGSAPTWQLLGIGLVFGVQNGLTIAPNQTAMYAQAPAEQTGVAAGLLRSFMYVGAIASASLISLVFGATATDADLHTLGVVLTVGAVVLLVATLADRTLLPSRAPARHTGTTR